MSNDNISFEGNDITTTANNSNADNTSTGVDQTDVQDIDTGKTDDINDQSSNTQTNNDNDTNSSNLEAGTVIEFDGVNYTVAENGDIVDKDGKVFKEAKDVKAWLDENQTSDDDDNEISIQNLQKQLGIEITDESGKIIEFTNTPSGIKAYVDSVIELQANTIRQGTINKFYQDNPMVKQFVDYVQLTGTPKGFGELPDRTGIQIEKDNKEQQVAIIRMAAKEFGNKSLNDNYIKYLDNTGSLYDEAKSQLEALQAKDKETRKNIETEAAKAREEERLAVETYFRKVNDVITSRKLGDYTLPEHIVKEENGKKVTLTLNDFYDYVSKSKEDEHGNLLTAYQRDLDKQSDDDLLAKELIDAWLMFTGGSYKDLINMIAKEDNVKKLTIRSKENRAKHQIKINKPKAKVSADDIIF